MDIVESLCKSSEELDELLLVQQEISLRVYADSNIRKAILLASASFFEKEISDLVMDYARSCTQDGRLHFLVQKKVVSRQYHTYFNWDGNNCNSFFALFGDDFKLRFSAMVKEDEELEKATKSFLEIGRERNRMVHQNFGSFSLEKTSKEIQQLHICAKLFVEKLRLELLN
jgi:hypothetical protein